MTVSFNHQRRVRFIRLAAWIVTISAGFLQVWAVRFYPTPDSTNYLDIASAILRGDWMKTVNAYWSPLFSWLLALCLRLFRPSAYWECAFVHLVNFAGLLAALLCFEFFFRSFLRMRKQLDCTGGEKEALPEFAWWALGYGLFVSTAFFVGSVTFQTPDIWVAALTYLAGGLVLHIRLSGGGWRLFAALGLTLGCAYLTKAFYFPMSFVFLATAFLAGGNPRRNIKHAALSLAVFLLLAGPWIAALSRSKQRLTFGDVGKLNYAMMVDQPPQPLFWQGENDTGTPKHPVRALLKKPRLYEFATPIGGTYPAAFDWSYWMEGARPRFDLRGQLRVLRQSAGSFFLIFLAQMEYGVALLTLIFLALGKSNWLHSIRGLWYVWAPPLVACLSYALVLVEGRYVAPFVLFLWVAAFSCFLAAGSELSRRVAVALVLAVLSVTGLRVAKSMETDVVAILSKQENVDWAVSEALRTLGIEPGHKVSILSAGGEVQWARLAGVTVVSEIPFGEESAFWTADPEAKRKVFHLLAGTGARVVVTKAPPPSAINEGWTPLGKTGFFAYRLLSEHQADP